MDRIVKVDRELFQAGLEKLNLDPSAPGGIITIPPKHRVTLNRTLSTETIPTHPRTGFFSLPYELRYQIYQLLIPVSDEIYSCNDPTRGQNWTTQHMTQLQTLLLVCRRMNEYEPVKEIFYKFHTFVVDKFSQEQESRILHQTPSRTWSHLVTSDPNQYFLNRFSWFNTMPQMRKMVFRLVPPGSIAREGSTVSSAVEISNPKVDFEHHAGWKQTLGNLSVLGLHILNAEGAEKYGFAEWLFQTLWSLVGALPIVPSTKAAAAAAAAAPTVSYRPDNQSPTSLTLPPGPMIVVYIEGSMGYGSNGRAQAAKDIVDSVIPKDRFRYVSCSEAMDTPFLDRNRITAAWGTGESQDLDQGLVKDALDDFFAERQQLTWERGLLENPMMHSGGDL